ncbi:MAG TPA: DUF488 domain-containing protein [Dokdonella sp.]|nr:DUF488 domain-containing protein [Dokdonella sp.]
MDRPFFTIGHSDRSLADFIALLRASAIERVVDVRRMPGSRTHPQFDADVLSASLADAGIAYEHAAALGGRRGKVEVAPDVNAYWSNRSFHNYADYALTAPFRAGLAHLLDAGHSNRCAIMCSEAVWWRCHRRIIADHLLAAGEAVAHIIGAGRVEPARLTPGAEVRADGAVVYPAHDAVR